RRFEQELEALAGHARVHLRKGRMVDALGGLIGDLKLDAVGIQGESMTVGMRADLAKQVGAKRLRVTRDMLLSLRAIKDDAEVRQIRKAVKVQQDALLATLPTIEPGQPEELIAARLEFEMKSRGAQRPSFGTIVAARGNGAKAHAVPGRTKTAAGRTLLIDWGAELDGYCSDMTRTFSLGRWPREMGLVYDIVLEAFHAGIDAVGPGVRASDVDAAAREVIRKAGYGDRFGHGLGHGIGLDVHELPRVSHNSTDELRPGMIVTIEPGVYLPGIGGVRIEDDILVTERGRRTLCSLPTDKDWATL
ncbi:MAG: M24 family metallopeptidase, partial [Planctomycetota bacterium]